MGWLSALRLAIMKALKSSSGKELAPAKEDWLALWSNLEQ